MIRINLLGQTRPKASRRPVDTGAALPVVFVGAGLVLGGLVLGYIYLSYQKQLNEENDRIKQLRAQKTELQQIKQQVENFEREEAVLKTRVATIEKLQRDRTGGQELLNMIANTVSRTDNLWLTDLERKGNNLTIQGEAASITSVANFITAMKRSGYFQKIEIKDSKQDTKDMTIQTFTFELTAEIGQPPVGTQATPANTMGRPGMPARKG
jgi:type IV pilus assembly protein PilN